MFPPCNHRDGIHQLCVPPVLGKGNLFSLRGAPVSCGLDVTVPSPGWDIPAGFFVSPGIGLFIMGCPISTCLNYHPLKKKIKKELRNTQLLLQNSLRSVEESCHILGSSHIKVVILGV